MTIDPADIRLWRRRLPRHAEAALAAGRAAGAASRKAGKGGGGVIDGNVALRLYPRALEMLSAGLHIALVSGTNGPRALPERASLSNGLFALATAEGSAAAGRAKGAAGDSDAERPMPRPQ